MARRLETATGLLVFASVAELGSFSAAAQALGLSKSAVSKQVSQLETRLGARLLQRTTRRLSLTEAGRALLARGQRVAAELDGVEADLGAAVGPPRGLLRLSAPMSFGQRHVAPRLPAFLAAYPGVQVELDLTDRVVDLIGERFDAAVRVGRLPDSTLVARRLAPARRVVCAAPAYLATHGVPRTPAALRQHACLDYTYLAAPGGWPFASGGRTRRVAVQGPLSSNNGEALREAALAGLGIALLPTFIVGDDLRAGRLRALLTAYECWDAAIFVVYPPTRHVAAKLRAFVDFLAAHCGPHPPWDVGLKDAQRG
ncbi:MAG: LysR family transcriptional regulator [Deltaproteobacteria bacterium]|nr:LysR family transcriptional regulator [Deltaproteobacteria bacterium]